MQETSTKFLINLVEDILVRLSNLRLMTDYRIFRDWNLGSLSFSYLALTLERLLRRLFL